MRATSRLASRRSRIQSGRVSSRVQSRRQYVRAIDQNQVSSRLASAMTFTLHVVHDPVSASSSCRAHFMRVFLRCSKAAGCSASAITFPDRFSQPLNVQHDPDDDGQPFLHAANYNSRFAPVRSTPNAAPRQRQPVSPFERVVAVVVLSSVNRVQPWSRSRALFFEAILAFE